MSGIWAAAFVVLWLLVIVLCVAVFALYHHFGQMYVNSREGRAAHGPDVDLPLRVVQVTDLAGEKREIPPYGRPAVLLFTSTTCPLCDELRSVIDGFAARNAEVETVVVCSGREAGVRTWSESLRVPVVADPRSAIAARYGIGMTPFVVATDVNGFVRGRGVVNALEQLDAAAEDALVAVVEPDRNVAVVTEGVR
jgi:methylamine dehydrogenase accessory protein MauD